MKSSWDETKKSSAYHFDTKRHDSRWDTVTGLGHIQPCWDEELKEIIKNSNPATWATRGYKGKGVEVPPADLAAEEYDLARAGANPKMTITHMNWDIPPVLQRISDRFALKDCMNRIHVQKPGESWTMHIDKLQKWCPEDPSQVMRIMIQLTDWQQGHFWNYGNYAWTHWRAGDVTTFDWENVPHSTANAGRLTPRVTFQLTGVRTAETERFLRELKNTTTMIV